MSVRLAVLNPVKPKIRAGLGLLFNYGDEDLAIT